MSRKVGVLLMAHGAAEGPKDLERYYTHIRRGRPPTPEALAELRRRYLAIGGHSPLHAMTAHQAQQLESKLNQDSAVSFRTAWGFKHAEPEIGQAVNQLLQAGVSDLVGLTLAPHFSPFSVGAYLEEAQTAIAGRVRWIPIASWHLAPGLITALSDRVDAGLKRMAGKRTIVLFSAHSLPERTLAMGDPYSEQVKATAAAVMVRLGNPAPWQVVWQSAGKTGEAWIGPELLSELARLQQEGYEATVLCPVGFVSDHLEILYDLDIEAKGVADRLGLSWTRTPSMNDAPDFIAALAEVVTAALEER